MRLSTITKPIIYSKAGHAFIAWLISLYIRFVYLTTKWTFIGFEERDEFAKRNDTGIVMQWHNRIGLVGFGWNARKHPISLLVSGHPDGRFVSSALGYLGMGAIFGSSSKGGAAALLQCIKTAKKGIFIGLTPDGPRGPRMRMKDGPVVIAKKTGAPMSLLAYSVRKRKVLKTWDRFILPKPFNEGVLMWRELDGISKDATDEETIAYKQYLEDELTKATNELDVMMGHAPIEAADPNEIPKKKKRTS
ncbi:lysophospholipid acyltransferase family protein [Curvivirga sp.]|uniref:lysophospholipid acyltransferase family protein n=1 Tax=Curvivirga sp. TaxID=2856848 RepID=UPI003B5C5FE4